VTASSELMHQLTAAAACLARFQQLTFTEHHQAQAAAQVHALAQAQLQTQNLQPLLPPPELQGPELAPIRATPVNEPPMLPPPSAVFGTGPSRQTSPPRSSMHTGRPLQFHHHPLSNPPPLHVPTSSSEPRRDLSSILNGTHVDTPRQTPVPSSSSASSSTSVSTSPSALHARMAVSTSIATTSTGSTGKRASSWTGYNEIESAWGYFDSRDLGSQDEDEHDELDDSHPHTSMRHRSPQDPRRSSSRMPQRTSDMRSTRSSSGPEDTPMRIREDSPMRTR
jgi:hypothetical protein